MNADPVMGVTEVGPSAVGAGDESSKRRTDRGEGRWKGQAQGTRGPRWLRLGGVPLFVWLLVALQGALMFMCTFLYPADYGYDEPQHVDMAYAYAQGHGLYGPGERRTAVGIKQTERGPGYPPQRPFSDVDIVPRGERQSIDEMGGDRPSLVGYPNQMVQHPPLYYLLGAGVFRVPGVAQLPYDQQIAMLRVLSILMMMPLPLLAWAMTRTWAGDGPIALAAGAMPLTLPNLARSGATFNNDNLAILLTSLILLLVARVVAGDLSRRTGVLLGLLMTGALLTKAFALVLPPVVLLAYLVAWRRFRRSLPWRPALLALLIGGIPGGLWWLHNLVSYGAVQPFGYGKENLTKIVGPIVPTTAGPQDFVTGFVERMSQRFYGGIGLPEGPAFPAMVAYIWTGMLVLAVLVGFAFGFSDRLGRTAVLVILAPTALSLVILARETYLVWAQHAGRFAGVQGRYMYPFFVPVAGLAVTGLAWVLRRRLARVLPLAVLVAALATQVVAWRTLLLAWWVPVGAAGDRAAMFSGAWAGLVRWSPWPEAVTAIPFVLVILLSLTCLLAAFLSVRSGRGQSEVTAVAVTVG